MGNTEKKKKSKKIWLLVILFLLSIVGAVSAFLIITKGDKTDTKKTNYDSNIYFANIKEFSGSVTATKKAEISNDDKTKLTYEVTLSKPGDFYQFNVDVKNDDSADCILNAVKSKMNGKSISKLPEYLEYSVTYNDGQEIKANQAIKSGKTKTYTVRIAYKKDLSEDNSPKEKQTLSMELNLDTRYAKKDETIEEVDIKLCKRASVLHTFIYTNKCDDCAITHNIGDVITYGNQNTTNGELKSGDAFDCDVNGDGVYDNKKERFYYVSDYYDTTSKSFNSDYATLIYYNNVKAGEPNNKFTYAYDYNYGDFYGPVFSHAQLPSTREWSNVKLFKETRQLLNENGETTTTAISLKGAATPNIPLGTFTYTDKVARLLTIQELNQACGITFPCTYIAGLQAGKLGTCEYLLENTRYATPNFSNWWLENAHVDSAISVWYVSSSDNAIRLAPKYDSNYAGVRPVIDVLKSNILY